MGIGSSSKKLKALPVQFIETPGGVILKRGCTEVRISGREIGEALHIIFTALDGTHTSEEICSRFAQPERPAVAQLLQGLIEKRMLVSCDSADLAVDEPEESSLAIFYWNFGQPVSEVTERLNSRHLAILGVNCISRQLAMSLMACGAENFMVIDYPLMRNLRLFDKAGKLRSDQWPITSKQPLGYPESLDRITHQSVDCLIATSDFGGAHAMLEWNKFCVQRQRHYFPVTLQNVIGRVGPLVIPGDTACYECLHTRQNSHNMDSENLKVIDEAAFEGQMVTGFHPSMASILGDMAAIELSKFYSGVLPMSNVGSLIEVNLLATQVTVRKVLKLPRCSVCSSLNTRSSMNLSRNAFATNQMGE